MKISSLDVRRTRTYRYLTGSYSFRNVHAIMHAPLGDDHFNVIAFHAGKGRDLPHVTASVADRHRLSWKKIYGMPYISTTPIGISNTADFVTQLEKLVNSWALALLGKKLNYSRYFENQTKPNLFLKRLGFPNLLIVRIWLEKKQWFLAMRLTAASITKILCWRNGNSCELLSSYCIASMTRDGLTNRFKVWKITHQTFLEDTTQGISTKSLYREIEKYIDWAPEAESNQKESLVL
ncbi:hypothetical protein L7F22_010480 [Adiantum nelumboides]|nr:hypothetical protein [Adiantum nelumboides]